MGSRTRGGRPPQRAGDAVRRAPVFVSRTERGTDVLRRRDARHAACPRDRAHNRGAARPQPARRLRAARAGRLRGRRGLPPGRRHPPCRSGGPRERRRRRPGCHRGGHARALQPHRPHRSLCTGAARRRRQARGVCAARPQPGRVRRSRDPACGRRRRRRGAAARRGARPEPGVDVRDGPRPAVRDLEVRDHARRAQRRRRRQQPLGELACRPGRLAPAARAVRRDAGRHQHRGGGRPGAHGARRVRRAACRTSRSAW